MAEEEADVNFERLSQEGLGLKKAALREKLARRLSKSKNAERSDAISLGARAVEIFAALGSQEKGATINEIQARTRLDLEVCQRVLNEFVRKALLRYENSRYYPSQTSLDLSSLGRDFGFTRLFGKVSEELNQTYRKKLSSNEELFFYCAYSVQREKLPEMKKRLRDVMLEFIDSEQMDDGDTVVKTILALYL